jgi:predicted outer membrane repeat protein
LSNFGGGVYVEATTTATINQTNITDNTSAYKGGGLYISGSDLTMTGGQLSNNTSTGSGGGFYFNATGMTLTLNQVSVTTNTSTDGYGGGGYVYDGTLAGNLGPGQLTGNTAGAVGFNGSLPGIGVSVGAFWTITVAPGQQKVEVNTL